MYSEEGIYGKMVFLLPRLARVSLSSPVEQDTGSVGGALAVPSYEMEPYRTACHKRPMGSNKPTVVGHKRKEQDPKIARCISCWEFLPSMHLKVEETCMDTL